jgi:hypothetical protein
MKQIRTNSHGIFKFYNVNFFSAEHYCLAGDSHVGPLGLLGMTSFFGSAYRSNYNLSNGKAGIYGI